jgi:hypothetical protein
MTQAKKLKKAIRARAAKTGERYTAARRHVLAARDRRSTRTKSKTSPRPSPSPVEAVAEARIRERTGHDLDHWFAVLDAFGAARKGHTAAARHLAKDHGVDGWYTQAITVSYERARGLRAKNQRVSGDYAVTVSKVLDVPLERVADALSRPGERTAWLRGSDPAIEKGLREALSGEKARTVRIRPGKLATLRYPVADGKRIELYVSPKAAGRSTISVAVTKIPSAAAVEAQRAAWRRAFESLKAHLEG